MEARKLYDNDVGQTTLRESARVENRPERPQNLAFGFNVFR